MVNQKRLRDVIVDKFSKEELAILCADIEQALRDAGIDDIPVSLDIVGGDGLPAIAYNLIVYLESKGRLDYLVEQLRVARPRLDIGSGEEADQPQDQYFTYIPPNRHKLFGRDTQIEQAVTALRNRQSLLLHGMGGIGKTALAAEVATQLRNSRAFENGVLWVTSVGSSSVEGICDTVARLLKDKRVPVLPPTEKPRATYDLLSTYNLLIVLDDVQDPRVALGFANVSVPQHNALLVTSRRRNAGYDRDLLIRPLQEQASIDMFSNLAQADAEDAAVAEICELLGYHPLALTVAANWSREEGLSVSSLYRRLSSAPSPVASLQRDGSSPADPNVWASLGLSYDALPDPQRHVFTHLAACFAESAGLELLAGICGLSQEECEDVAGRLVAWSLAERSDDRYSMHSLVKDFGQEILRRDGQLQEVQEKIATELYSYVRRHMADSYEDYRLIASELDNVLGALKFGREMKLERLTQNLAAWVIFSKALYTLGYWAEALAIGELGITSTTQSNDEVLYASLIHNTAIIHSQQGNYEQARELYQQSLEIYRKLGNQAGIANSLHSLGIIEQAQGNYEQARELYQQSLDIKRKLGNQAGIASSLYQLGKIEQQQGNYEQARELYQQSLDIERKLGNQAGIAISLGQLGKVASNEGDKEGACRLFQEALEIFDRLKSPYAESVRQWLAELDDSN